MSLRQAWERSQGAGLNLGWREKISDTGPATVGGKPAPSEGVMFSSVITGCSDHPGNQFVDLQFIPMQDGVTEEDTVKETLAVLKGNGYLRGLAEMTSANPETARLRLQNDAKNLLNSSYVALMIDPSQTGRLVSSVSKKSCRGRCPGSWDDFDALSHKTQPLLDHHEFKERIQKNTQRTANPALEKMLERARPAEAANSAGTGTRNTSRASTARSMASSTTPLRSRNASRSTRECSPDTVMSAQMSNLSVNPIQRDKGERTPRGRR